MNMLPAEEAQGDEEDETGTAHLKATGVIL